MEQNAYMNLIKDARFVRAKIAFDSFRDPAITGLRGSCPEPARRFILRDEEYDIHIKMSGDDDHRQIHGQLLPRSGTGFAQPAQCHLLRNGARFQSTSTNETGEFHFADVPAGDLNLQVDLPGLTIVGSLNP
jgi:hypothetical protein